MATATLVLAILIVIVSEIHGNSIHQRNIEGFVYLGSLGQKSNKARAVEYDEFNYYISTRADTWSDARRQCKLAFGDNSANIVALESEEESNFVNDLLDLNAFVGSVWTSGTYDTSAKVWRWDSTGTKFPNSPSWAPWKGGAPPTSANGLLRVALNFINKYSVEWQAQMYTASAFYVCEVPRVDIPVPCYDTNDLAIVLDSSGSIGALNFEVAKEFVAKLASAFTLHDQSRLSLIVYSSFVSTVIPLNNNLTPAEIDSAILNAFYQGYSTATDLGIDTAVSQLISNERSVPRNIVVLTDGYSDNWYLTAEAASNAANHKIRSFSVGITPYVSEQELLTIALGNQNRVFTLDTFDDLIRILTPLSLRICSLTV